MTNSGIDIPQTAVVDYEHVETYQSISTGSLSVSTKGEDDASSGARGPRRGQALRWCLGIERSLAELAGRRDPRPLGRERCRKVHAVEGPRRRSPPRRR